MKILDKLLDKIGQSRNPIKTFLYLANTLILAAHTFLLIFFFFTGVRFMACVNVVSILTYSVLFCAIRDKRSRTYIISVIAEVIFHMLLAVACMGWNYGFQFYCFGAMGMAFYTDYFYAQAKLKRVNTATLSLISGGSFLAALFISRYRQPEYVLGDGVATVIFVINAMFMFVFVALCFWLLVSKAVYYEGELVRQANHDKLTGLVNRNYLLAHLQKAYEEEEMSDYWLAMLDIDNFKKINDTWGHNCGDYVLKSVAGLISENSCGMTACRWGGEEFILVGRLAEQRVDVPGSANFVMERIRRAVENYDFRYEDRELTVTVTIGLSRYEKERNVDEWINAADTKLYQGKQRGKNRLVV